MSEMKLGFACICIASLVQMQSSKQTTVDFKNIQITLHTIPSESFASSK